jgi:hypothetical protein
MPETPKREVRELIRRSRAAVEEAMGRMALSRAWEQLQERDAEGDPQGPLPYTEPALGELAVAHARDPEDIGVVHHLAIAHHARAWDLELAGGGWAAREWERALGYWRVIAASAEFWNRLERKYRECDPEAAASPVAALRRDLLEDLLDVHVDFIRRYSESQTPDRANAHLEIVRRASIPPAVRRRLTDKVFDAMTGSVPEAKATRNFESALTLIERFLALFPDHLPALRMHAEIGEDLISGLSYKDNWDEIVAAEQRARPHAGRLAEHPDLARDPLARRALEELAVGLGRRSNDRAFAALTSGDRVTAREAAEVGIWWGRLAGRDCPEEAPLRNLYAICLFRRVGCLDREAAEVGRDRDVDERTKRAAGVRLYRQAITDLEEALAARPAARELVQHLEQALTRCRDIVTRLETELRLGGRG